MVKTAEYSKNIYLQSAEQVEQEIHRYSAYADMYTGLSTSKSESGSRGSVNRRQVIMLDFDKKDFPEYTELKDFVKHVKERIPGLYYHCITDTGGGYHFYYAVELTDDCERVSNINRQLAELAGADVKAAIVTQMDRLPTSKNFKYNPPKPVSVIVNTYGTKKHKPYSLNRLENIIRKLQIHQEAEEKVLQCPAQPCNTIKSFYCTEAMISIGAAAGARNFCIGRICNYLRDIRGYKQSNAYETVKEFNARCTPPKTEGELKSQFNAYWDNASYKLLGCSFQDKNKMAILQNYCDKTMCNNATYQNALESVEEAPTLLISNQRLRREDFNRMRGNHYLVMTVLSYKERGLTRREIEHELTPRKGKCILSRDTLSKVLNDLIDFKQVVFVEKGKLYQLKDVGNFGQGHTQYYYSGAVTRINGIIGQQEYLIYLALIKCLQQNKNASYEELSILSGIDKRNISRYIAGLEEAHMLVVHKIEMNSGGYRNTYQIRA